MATCCFERHREKHSGPLIFKNKRRHVVVSMVGEPNVGKSSTLNSLLGTHRVAVSSHPGRTKHYQTHFMTADLMLCDCPGLVFPRAGVPLPMQVLYGSYPIARCRDPYSVVSYLCERLWPRLHKAWGLKKVPSEDMEDNRYGTVTAGSSGRPYSKAASTLCAHQDLVQYKTSVTHVEGAGTVAAPRVKAAAETTIHEDVHDGDYGDTIHEDVHNGDYGDTIHEDVHNGDGDTIHEDVHNGDGDTIHKDVHDGDSSGLEKEEAWSTAELLEAVAAHKNWRSRRGGRLDVYRAANWVLRNALAGRPDTCLAFLPPQNTSTGKH
ncbi:hypothetical protein CEUSTIGMA_g7704.t1 [Chlamydomonas eustigma]|uniref:Guanine nucleotide-binding protein-like 1 n=1 Tax=Chlamydomonas eustigma TaxID=1157962 RepID=A0A250XB30_9CHLO|nr:hypothetical protein CEUSTIGMA_g7704.t1 [Chlamydomonas eustigma]|eukprot:GAX80266.1 hypothetical protein CEUSTIGMA_g7704.t1 [Chlamydomonas eustigma]